MPFLTPIVALVLTLTAAAPQAPTFAAEAVATPAQPAQSAYALPHNLYGAHLLVSDGAPGTRGHNHLRWARHLVGRWGFAKTLLGDIDRNTRGPRPGWIDYVNTCHKLELIPVLRLAGRYDGGAGHWIKPEADAPGDYSSMAEAVKQVVSGIPRSDLCPLYIELWNEPNLNVEWTGKADHDEYAAFFVQVARAIRSIGDKRIRILNGGLATSPEWAEKLCQAQPDFINMFDFWSCHPYPMNRPPSFNHHDRKVPPDSDLTIDAYLLELDVLKRHGRSNVEVMITETGHDVGNRTFTQSEGHPIIDEWNRADYMVRAFRDYWPRWKEVHAVFPFEFCNENWQRFDWVHPDSETGVDGAPTKPHYQYTCVAALAKPTDTTGTASGTVTVARLGSRLEGAKVWIQAARAYRTDPMGNYFLPNLDAGTYTVNFNRAGFKPAEQKIEIVAGRNTVCDLALEAEERGELVGVVTSGDDEDKPIQGATITLEPGNLRTRTDRRGRYEFTDCIPARYTIKATADRYRSYEAGGVEIVANRKNEHDFKLGRKAEPDTENLLANAGMEAGGGGGGKEGIALGFEPLFLARDHWCEIVDREAHTGRRSQKLHVASEEIAVRQITHYNTAKPGTGYMAGVWIKTDIPDDEGTAYMTLSFTDNGGAVLRRSEAKPKVKRRSGKWIWVSTEDVAPPGSQRISVNLHTSGKTGRAFFDDAFLGVVR